MTVLLTQLPDVLVTVYVVVTVGLAMTTEPVVELSDAPGVQL